MKERGNKVAIIWEADTPNESKKITYNDLHSEVCKFANGLRSLGVKKGDRVTIYLSPFFTPRDFKPLANLQTSL